MTQDLFNKPAKKPRGIHPHSRKCWNEERAKLDERKSRIVDNIIVYGDGTDREIMTRMGYTDPNSVRPRITELVDTKMLIEKDSTKCKTTGKTVRVVGLPKW